MINYMQTNQEAISNNYIISNIHHETLYNKLKDNNKEGLFKYIQNLSRDYNLDKKSIIKLFLNYYTKHYIDEITKDKLLFMKTLLHNNISDTDLFVNYFIHTFSSFF